MVSMAGLRCSCDDGCMTTIYEATIEATGIDPCRTVVLPQGKVPITKRDRHRFNRQATRLLREAGFTA